MEQPRETHEQSKDSITPTLEEIKKSVISALKMYDLIMEWEFDIEKLDFIRGSNWKAYWFGYWNETIMCLDSKEIHTNNTPFVVYLRNKFKWQL